MANKIVACVILNYNDASTTINLVQSIKDYALLNYIVVVDNCSTDDSLERLQGYKNEKIHIIKSEKNGGYGAGNNVGLRYSSEILDADYSIVANPDVLFDEKCVENEIILRHHPAKYNCC